MILVDMSHPLAFHIQPFMDGEEIHDAVAGLFPDYPGLPEVSWLKRWHNPPHLGNHADFYQEERMVSWEARANSLMRFSISSRPRSWRDFPSSFMIFFSTTD